MPDVSLITMNIFDSIGAFFQSLYDQFVFVFLDGNRYTLIVDGFEKHADFVGFRRAYRHS